MNTITLVSFIQRIVRRLLWLVLLFVFAPAVAPAQMPPDGFPALIEAVKSSPGCLGVEVARTTSGKNVLFAWFEDKHAVLRWYASAPHQHAMRAAPAAAHTGRPPLEHVPDGSGPILIIASVGEGQIGIELYAPLPGGLAVGGRFSPEQVRIPNLNVLARSGPRAR